MKSLTTLLLSAALLSSGSVYAQKSGLLTDAGGRVLYTFDKDSANKSNCNGGCLAAWPAYVAKSGDKAPGAGFAAITRDDGSQQWALNGKPLYFYAGDAKPGDANGDNQGGVWHVVKQGGGERAANASGAPGAY